MPGDAPQLLTTNTLLTPSSIPAVSSKTKKRGAEGEGEAPVKKKEKVSNGFYVMTNGELTP